MSGLSGLMSGDDNLDVLAPGLSHRVVIIIQINGSLKRHLIPKISF